MSKVDVSGWPTVAEAAEQLETSVRTVTRYGQGGRLEIRKRPREGKKPENVCNPRDLEKLLPSEAHLVEEPRDLAPVERNGAAHAPVPAVIHQLESAVNQIVAHYKKGIEAEFAARWSAAQALPPHRKYWLTLEEAALVSGLAKSDLRRLCKTGTLVARKSHGWKIRRASLKEFAG